MLSLNMFFKNKIFMLVHVLGWASMRWHRTWRSRGWLGIIPRYPPSAGKAATGTQTQREGGAGLRFLQTHGSCSGVASSSAQELPWSPVQPLLWKENTVSGPSPSRTQ